MMRRWPKGLAVIDYEIMRAWGWLLALATNGLLAWIGWSLRKKFVTHEDFAAHLTADAQHKTATKECLAAHDVALEVLADKVNAMPGADAIHVLDLKLVNIQGEQSRTNEELRGLRDIMRRMENQTELLIRDRLEGK